MCAAVLHLELCSIAQHDPNTSAASSPTQAIEDYYEHWRGRATCWRRGRFWPCPCAKRQMSRCRINERQKTTWYVSFAQAGCPSGNHPVYRILSAASTWADYICKYSSALMAFSSESLAVWGSLEYNECAQASLLLPSWTDHLHTFRCEACFLLVWMEWIQNSVCLQAAVVTPLLLTTSPIFEVQAASYTEANLPPVMISQLP